ncbi:hypothetical protein [Neobacillus niacini]|uniref:hypothetical protein n=1 Tax=Neobacillus niacini TaxID=86668 RepID=UPI0005F0B7FC|nr:hypothetical protein [Neobacillus niacini]
MNQDQFLKKKMGFWSLTADLSVALRLWLAFWGSNSSKYSWSCIHPRLDYWWDRNDACRTCIRGIRYGEAGIGWCSTLSFVFPWICFS